MIRSRKQRIRMYKAPDGILTADNPLLTHAIGTDPHKPNRRFVHHSPAGTQLSLPYLQANKIDPNEQVVSFLPVEQKGPNYLSYCSGILSDREKPKDIGGPVWKYTSGPDWYCSVINLALAYDTEYLINHGKYIKQLKYSIANLPMRYNGTVMRGLNMGRTEIDAYESMRHPFYIPSFTSTSKTKAFEGNTVLHIDISPEWSKYCMEIPPALTKYAYEDEVLLSCYNLYSRERTEKSSGQNSQKYIKLRLMGTEQHRMSAQQPIINPQAHFMGNKRRFHRPVHYIPIYGWQ